MLFQLTQRQIMVVLVLLIGIASMIGVSVWVQATAQSSPTTSAAQAEDATPTADLFAWERQQMATIEAALAYPDPDLSADERRIYEEELDYYEEMITSVLRTRTEVAAARAYPEPRQETQVAAAEQAPTDTIPTSRPVPTGILEGFNSPLPSSRGKVSTAWQDYADGIFIQVYAGRLTDDTTQGFVMVIKSNEAGEDIGGTSKETPIKDGRLKITEADGVILTLTGETGTTVRFNAETMEFLPEE